MKNNINIALVSPNKESVSETFVRAHRELLPGNVRHYYWGLVPEFLEGAKLSRGIRKLLTRVYGRAFLGRDCYDIEHAFQRSLRREKIDVVLAEYGPVGASCLAACQRAEVPLIVHFHGRDASCREELERYHEQYRVMFKEAAAIVVVSHKMQDDLLRLGVPEEKLVLNHYGPSDDFFELTPPVGQCRHCVGIGRFTDKKAPYYAILAFKKALAEFPDARLTLVGDGPLLPTCRNLVRYLGIEHAVDFTGAKPHDEVKQLLATATAFVQHSITADDGDSEGTPVVILEAAAAGLPVVATRHAGIPDVVIDGETGLLVDEHDVAGMAKQLIRLFREPGLAVKLGTRARDHVRANFSMSRHISVLDRLLRDCVKG